jgi:hypothetical protein
MFRLALKGQDVNAELPHIADAGQGVNAELPMVKNIVAELPYIGDVGQVNNAMIKASRKGQGVNAALPYIADTGRGANARLPYVEDTRLVTHKEAAICAWFNQLSDRLCDVRICYGDWTRVLTPSLILQSNLGIFFDPPYTTNKIDIYYDKEKISDEVRQWCIEHMDPIYKNIKIILCGYGTEHDDLLEMGWHKIAWKAKNGYNGRGKINKVDLRDEQMWCSPNIDIERQMIISSPQGLILDDCTQGVAELSNRM